MSTEYATFADPNIIPVVASEHLGQKRLTIDIPNGWDDCKKLCRRVISYRGENYTFTGWNSDTNKCFFIQTPDVATVGKQQRRRS